MKFIGLNMLYISTYGFCLFTSLVVLALLVWWRAERPARKQYCHNKSRGLLLATGHWLSLKELQKKWAD